MPRDLDAILDESGPMPLPPAQIAVGMPQDLIRRRPDIRRAEWLLAAQSAQIGVAITELYPHFNLGGSIGVATTDIGSKGIDDLFDPDSISSLLTGGFTWNVFNYGTLKNNVRFQDARFQELLVDYQNLVLTAQAEVNDAIVAYLQAHTQASYLAAERGGRRTFRAAVADSISGRLHRFQPGVDHADSTDRAAGRIDRNQWHHRHGPRHHLQGARRWLASRSGAAD